MKERPIIFSTDMVKAIFEGKKTRTRRVITHYSVPNDDLVDFQEFLYIPENNDVMSPNEGYYALFKCNANQDNRVIYFRCPYGKVGDRLWVREAWRTIMENGTPNDFGVVYKDGGISFYQDNTKRTNYPMEEKWRPSIFMPRWASRILLEITGVRVERVQDIDEGDAIAEGIPPFAPGGIKQTSTIPRKHFSTLWDSINDKRGYSWSLNPWIWVIEFKRVAR